MRWLILASALLMSGCMSEGQSYTDLVGAWRVEGDANAVKIVATSQEDAQPLAAGHCDHFKKAARFQNQDDRGDFHYACVARS